MLTNGRGLVDTRTQKLGVATAFDLNVSTSSENFHLFLKRHFLFMNLFARDFLVSSLFLNSSPAIIGIICQLGGTWLFRWSRVCQKLAEYTTTLCDWHIRSLRRGVCYIWFYFDSQKLDDGWCYTSKRVSLWYFPAPMCVDVLLLYYGETQSHGFYYYWLTRAGVPTLVLFNIEKRSQDPFQFLLVNCWHPRCVCRKESDAINFFFETFQKVAREIKRAETLYQRSFGSYNYINLYNLYNKTSVPFVGSRQSTSTPSGGFVCVCDGEITRWNCLDWLMRKDWLLHCRL